MKPVTHAHYLDRIANYDEGLCEMFELFFGQRYLYECYSIDDVIYLRCVDFMQEGEAYSAHDAIEMTRASTEGVKVECYQFETQQHAFAFVSKQFNEKAI